MDPISHKDESPTASEGRVQRRRRGRSEQLIRFAGSTLGAQSRVRLLLQRVSKCRHFLQRSRFPAVEIFPTFNKFPRSRPKPTLAELLRILSRRKSASTEEMKARHGYAAAAERQIRSAESPERHESLGNQQCATTQIF